MADQGGTEAGQWCERRLLEDAEDSRTFAGEAGGNGQQQRSTARDHHALAGDWHAGFYHRLQTACSHHTGQGPSGEWKEAFARAGGENQAVELDVFGVGGVFKAQDFRGRIRDDTGSAAPLQIRGLEALLKEMELA